MKKLYTMIAMALMALSLTSCDDSEIARTLEGTWRGNMYISTRYRGNDYNSTYTEVTFLRNPYAYSSGTGYWVDYYSGAPWDYVANNIRWTVDMGVIHVDFIEERTSIEIRRYDLNGRYFSGQLYDNGKTVNFDLENVSRPSNYYNNYRWGYDAWYDDDYYWARTRSAGDSTAVDSATVEKPVRFIR